MSESTQISGTAESGGTKVPSQRVNSFVFIDSKLLEIQTVTIHADQGTIWATPNGGALRAEANKPVRWQSDQPFVLSFMQLGGSKEPLGPLPAEWDECDRVWRKEVIMRSGAAAPFYEYSVKIGDLTLDPIVIVDK